jgi:hypothetical protein
MEAAKELATQVYVEQRLRNHPDPDYARHLVEGRNPESKEQVDQLLEASIQRPVKNEDMETTRARVRDMIGSGTMEHDLTEDNKGYTNGQNGTGQNYNGLGMELGDIRALSGLPENPNSN